MKQKLTPLNVSPNASDAETIFQKSAWNIEGHVQGVGLF